MDLVFGLSAFCGSILVSYFSKRRCQLLYHKDGEIATLLDASGKDGEDLKSLLLNYGAVNWIWRYIDYTGMFQTFYYTRYRFHKYAPASINYIREELTLPDQGLIALDWHRNPALSDDNKPIVVLQHGLAGHSKEKYILSMIDTLDESGDYAIVTFIARGCAGLPLKTPETFTAARTEDYEYALEHVMRKYPKRALYLVSYSLGAGINLKWLGLKGREMSGKYKAIKGCVAVSPQYDCHNNTGLFSTLSRGLVINLIRMAKKHRTPLADHSDSQILFNDATKARNIYEFDQAVIVGKPHPSDAKKSFLHFPTVEDYYTRSSCINYTHNITLPTLVIGTEDDPVCNGASIPWSVHHKHHGISHAPAISKSTAVMVTPVGGHVGFGYGLWGDKYMTDEAALLFFQLLRSRDQ